MKISELPAFAAGEEDYDIPANGEAIRDLTVAHVMQMATVPWKTETKIDFSRSTDWTAGLVYRAGVQYRGVPYVSGRMDGDSDIYEFSDALKGGGIYGGPKSWQTMIGSDCGGGPRLGFAWSGALYECSPGNDFSYEPLPENFSLQGMAPVGDYSWQSYDRTKRRSTRDTVMEATGRDAMYACYAAVRRGDAVWSYFISGEHIRLVIADAVTVYGRNGRIDPDNSYLRIIEQTSGIRSLGDGSYSTWNTADCSFRDLFDTGYIPLTMTAYNKETVETPAFTANGISLAGEVTPYSLLTGRVQCNYNIFKLEALITDGAGRTVSVGTAYPYMITADLSRMKFSVKLTDIPSGNYRYRLTAVTGYGTKVLVDTDIRYTCIRELAVYIADNGTGNGLSPDAPLGNAAGYTDITRTSFKNSALYRAVQLLSRTGGTVVVCGKVTILSGHYYGDAASSDFVLPGVPVEGTTVKLTSVYNGVDYRKTGACITVEKTRRMSPDIELKIGTVWDDIDLVYRYQNGVSKYNVIACCNKPTLFGEGFRVKVFYDGKELAQERGQSGAFPVVCGGYRYSVEPGDTALTVMGGTFRDAVAGPCGVDSKAHGILEGNASVTIGGRAIILSDVYGGSHDTCGSVSGDIGIRITGGTVYGNIFLAGGGGMESTGSTATLTVTGTSVIGGWVFPIGNSPVHYPAARTVLDFSEADAEAVLPNYNAGKFTEIRERRAEETTHKETTEKVTAGGPAETDPPHTGTVTGMTTEPPVTTAESIPDTTEAPVTGEAGSFAETTSDSLPAGSDTAEKDTEAASERISEAVPETPPADQTEAPGKPERKGPSLLPPILCGAVLLAGLLLVLRRKKK